MDNVNELLYYYFTGDEEAIQALIHLHRPMSVSIIKSRMSHMINYNSVNDYLNLADMVLMECIDRCRVDQYTLLKAFYRRSLNNRLIDQQRASTSHEVEYHYTTVALDQLINEDTQHYVSDIIEDSKALVHEEVMYRLEKEAIAEELPVYFSSYERRILRYKQMGYTTREIADQLGVSVRKIRYILLKIKKWYLAR